MKKNYPHVRAAVRRGDSLTCAELGRRGGRATAAKRRRKKAPDAFYNRHTTAQIAAARAVDARRQGEGE